MKARTFRLGTAPARENFWLAVKGMIDRGQEPVATLKQRERTIPQNSMFYALYGQIAGQLDDMTAGEIRAHCKLNYGVPILCAYDPQFREMWVGRIQGSMPYEQQLVLVTFLDVTSKFDKSQGSEYIDEIIKAYSMQGLCLLHPSEMN